MTSLPAPRFLDRTTPPHIVTLILLSGVSALNVSIFLPSLVHMADWFGADYAVMQLAVSGYLAATAVLQVLVGPLADRFGRRPVVIGALVVFLLATLGTLLASDVRVFLAFRMAQAAVATGLALSRAIVRDMVPANEAASKIGYVTMGMALVPMVGPMIGGALDTVFGWHGSFAFLLIAGAVVLVLAIADLGETGARGTITLAAQMAAWPDLLRSPRFWGYSMATSFASGAFFALLGGTAFVANEVFGLSSLWAGIALGSPAVGYAAGNYMSGRSSVRVGIDRMALAGGLVSTTGMALSLVATLAGLGHPAVFFGFCTLLGFGNGMLLPNATAGSLSVRPNLAGTASGLGGAIMIGGGAAMSALAGAVLNPGSGTLPLQAIMLATSAMSVVSILLVIRRNRRLNA